MEENKENNVSKEWKCVQQTNKNNLGNIKGMFFVILSLVILIGSIVGGMKLYEYVEENKTVNVNKKEDSVKVDENKEVVTQEFNVDELYNYVHKMTNTIIIPGDGKIMGREQVTKQSIEKALAEAKDRDTYIYDEVKKWQALDFNNAVNVHNYVWEKLDGNIGKAQALNDKEIESIKFNLE